jgi:hypothetical protein
MSLVLFTHDGIYNYYEAYLMKLFTSITNNEIPALDYSPLGKPYLRANTGVFVKLEEKIEVYKLVINFNHDTIDNRQTKSLEFIQYLIT